MWRTSQRKQAEAPCHDAKGGFLSAFPVRPRVRRVMLGPVFEQRPEGRSIPLVTACRVSTSECERDSKPAGLPHKLDVATLELVNVRPVPVHWDMFTVNGVQ